MADFKKFMAVWLSVAILGTVLTGGTLKILYTQSEQIEQSNTLTEGSNHFSVQWMGFSPTDYSNLYPDYYICINNLAENTLTMQIALKILNQEAYGYYFLIEQYSAPPAGWTISTYYIGYIDVDQTLTFAYSDIERSRPSSISGGVLTESVNLVVKAYWDSSYTNLYSQDNFAVTFNFIDRTAAVWTQLYNADFDDATTQGWSATGTSPSMSVSTTYYRSFQYSLSLQDTYAGGGDVGYTRSFDITGPYTEAYLIFSIRSDKWGPMRIDLDSTTCFKPDLSPSTGIWYQFTIPLPVGTLTQVTMWSVEYPSYNSAYLDDVFVIAK